MAIVNNEIDHLPKEASSENGHVNETYHKTEENEKASEPSSYSTDSATIENVSNTAPQIKVYRRRWIMLLIFSLVSMINAFQWIQFSIITSIIMRLALFFYKYILF